MKKVHRQSWNGNEGWKFESEVARLECLGGFLTTVEIGRNESRDHTGWAIQGTPQIPDFRTGAIFDTREECVAFAKGRGWIPVRSDTKLPSGEWETVFEDPPWWEPEGIHVRLLSCPESEMPAALQYGEQYWFFRTIDEAIAFADARLWVHPREVRTVLANKGKGLNWCEITDKNIILTTEERKEK